MMISSVRSVTYMMDEEEGLRMHNNNAIIMVRLKEVDHNIINQLREGDRTQSFLVDETGYSRQYIHQRLEVLEAAGYIENIHAKSALYHLIKDPEEDES